MNLGPCISVDYPGFCFFFSHLILRTCAGFAPANCDWLGRTIAFYQVFFQQVRLALGKWCIGPQRGHPRTPGMDIFCTVPRPHFLGRTLIWPGYFGEHVLGLLDYILRVCQSLWNSFLYLGKLHWFLYLLLSYFLWSWHVYFRLEFKFRVKSCVEREHGSKDGISCLLPCILLLCIEWTWT